MTAADTNISRGAVTTGLLLRIDAMGVEPPLHGLVGMPVPEPLVLPHETVLALHLFLEERVV